MGLKALLNDTHRLTPIIKDWSDTCIRVRSFIIFPADSDEVPIAARRHYSNVYWPNAYIGLSRVLVAVPRFIPLDGHWHLEKTKTYVNGAPELMNLGTGQNASPSPNAHQRLLTQSGPSSHSVSQGHQPGGAYPCGMSSLSPWA